MTTRVNIVAGPSKFDLMLALFDRKPVNTRHVTFEISASPGVHLPVIITGVDAESGCGESWLLRGCTRSVPAGPADVVPAPPRNVAGWYKTNSRKGFLDFID